MSGRKVIPIYRKVGPKGGGDDSYERARDVEVVMDALPQIVAVVEAAKLGRHYTKAMHEWYFKDVGDIATADTIYAHVEKIDAALAALDEALS